MSPLRTKGDIEVKGQGPTKVITVCSTPLKSYDPDKLRSEEADEAEGEANTNVCQYITSSFFGNMMQSLINKPSCFI
jgi:hypothetical protein